MNETDYNALLYEKMKAEQNKYRDRLLHKEPSEILNHTYEYTMREDIVMCMEELELEPEKAAGLVQAAIPVGATAMMRMVPAGVLPPGPASTAWGLPQHSRYAAAGKNCTHS